MSQMNALSEAIGLLHPVLFVQANRMIMARWQDVQALEGAYRYRQSVTKKAIQAEAARLVATQVSREKLCARAFDRECRKAFNRAVRRIEKRVNRGGSIVESATDSKAVA